MKQRWMAICLLAGIVASAPASAVLIDRGDFTRDTSTGLDWLDLTLTQGLSFQDVLGGAGGYFGSGWRFATVQEFDALAGRYLGFGEGVFAGGDGGVAYGEALDLVSLLGATFVQLTPPDPSSDPVTRASIGFYDDGKGGDRVGLGQIEARFFDPLQFTTPAGYWVSYDDFLTTDRSYFQVGSLLVKRFRPLPEPSTLTLFGLGLLGLGFARRRKLN